MFKLFLYSVVNIYYYFSLFMGIGDWGLGIGDWGLASNEMFP